MTGHAEGMTDHVEEAFKYALAVGKAKGKTEHSGYMLTTFRRRLEELVGEVVQTPLAKGLQIQQYDEDDQIEFAPHMPFVHVCNQDKQELLPCILCSMIAAGNAETRTYTFPEFDDSDY